MSLIGLLIALLIICIVLWAARALMAAFSVEDPIRTVIYVILVILILVWLLNMLGYGGGLGSFRLH
jgi:hypothetical protein